MSENDKREDQQPIRISFICRHSNTFLAFRRMERIQTEGKLNPSLSALNLSRDITSDTEVGKE